MKSLSAVVTAATLSLAVAAGFQAQPEPKPAGTSIPPGHPQIPLPKVGENWPKAAPADVESIDAIVKAFYEAPAGDPGQARNWDRYLSLFVPDARLIPARPGVEGTSGAFFLPVPEYVDANKKYFEKGGFFDKEVARRVESFGNIVHVWSTYESRRKSTDAAPYSRGINSIQLLKDGPRYWIVNVYWDYERPEAPLPDKYLSSPKE